MPNVTIDPGEYQRFELKSAPPDGFIMLRPLPYGLKLARRSQTSKMMMRAQQPKRGQKATDMEQVYELQSLDEVAASYDFKYCIGDHNLTDANGVLLDFSNPMTIKLLNPKVGSEIEKLIDDLNNDEDEESFEDFLRQHTSSSEEEMISSEEDGQETTPTPVTS